jgi:flagellar hook-basal body complex protein FliE
MTIDRASTAAQAAKLYANTQKSSLDIKGTGDSDIQFAGANQTSFADLLRGAAEESIQTLRQNEKISAMAITGKADITDIVQAANNADATLRTVRGIRDAMLQAYQEIMRMPI